MAERLIQFLIMRAFRHGAVTAGDLCRASGVSLATATRAMQRALACHAEIVFREKRALKPIPLASAPDFASEAALLDALSKGSNQALETGLFSHELPVSYVSWTNTLPPKPGILDQIVKAISRQTVLEIIYLAMTEGALPEEKTIFPLALEKMNDQWRLIAQDIQKSGAPKRVYVLSRILNATPSPRRRPRGMIRRGHHDSQVAIRVEIEPRFSPLQSEVLSRELCIADGTVKIASRSEFEFCRRFTDMPANPDAIWPPLIVKKGTS